MGTHNLALARENSENYAAKRASREDRTERSGPKRARLEGRANAGPSRQVYGSALLPLRDQSREHFADRHREVPEAVEDLAGDQSGVDELTQPLLRLFETLPFRPALLGAQFS